MSILLKNMAPRAANTASMSSDARIMPPVTNDSFIGKDGPGAGAGAGAEWEPTRDFLLAFLALCTLVLAVAIDSTSLSVALPIMSTDLGGTALQAFWSGTSFLLASTVLQPSVASMSNILGRKLMLYVSCFLFALGSLIAGLAGDFTIVLLGRTVQGVGGGSLIALTEVVITDLVPLAKRGAWFSGMSAIWSFGTVTGPLIGAGFAEKVSWKWIFYINLPIIALGFVFVVLFLKQEPIPGNTMEKLRAFDWVGSAVFTIGATAFLFGLTTGGVMYEWSSWRCLTPLILGPIIIVGFGYWEIRYAIDPIVNRDIFNNWTLISTYIQTIFHSIILWALLFFLVLYYQAVKLYSPIIAATAVLPETLTVAPSAVVVGAVAGYTLRYRWGIWVGWAMTTFGAAILYLLDVNTTIPSWIFINVPIGIGTGMLFPGLALSVQAASEPELNGQAAAFFSFLRTFGQSLGVAISGVIFQNAFRSNLERYPAFAPYADAYSRDATVVVGLIQSMPEGDDKDQLRQAYADGLKILWLSMVAFSLVGMCFSATIKGYSLEQEHVTKQALRQQKVLSFQSDMETGRH